MGFLGMRGTDDWVANQRPQNWREMILRLYPNGQAPLTAIMSKMGSEKTTDPIYHWWQKSLPDQRAVVTGVYTDVLSTAYTSGGAAGDTLYVKMSAADVSKFIPSHQILLRDASNLTVDANAKVTAVTVNGASSYLTIKLLEADDNGVGNDLSDSDVCMIIGTINSEGGTSNSSMMYDPTEYSNYTQIFKTALEHTRTASRTTLRTGDQVKEAKREALELHGIEMEKAFIFGVKSSGVGANGKPERTTGGIKSFLTTNVADYTKATGTATWLAGGEEWLDNMFEQIFRYGRNEKLALCGSGALLGINRLAKQNGTFELTAAKKSYGISVLEWLTPYGSIYLKTHPLFSYEATMRNSMLILEPENLKYRFVDDTKYEPKIQANDLDGEKSQFITEAGLELHFEQSMGYLQGVGQDNP